MSSLFCNHVQFSLTQFLSSHGLTLEEFMSLSEPELISLLNVFVFELFGNDYIVAVKEFPKFRKLVITFPLRVVDNVEVGGVEVEIFKFIGKLTPELTLKAFQFFDSPVDWGFEVDNVDVEVMRLLSRLDSSFQVWVEQSYR